MAKMDKDFNLDKELRAELDAAVISDSSRFITTRFAAWVACQFNKVKEFVKGGWKQDAVIENNPGVKITQNVLGMDGENKDITEVTQNVPVIDERKKDITEVTQNVLGMDGENKDITEVTQNVPVIDERKKDITEVTQNVPVIDERKKDITEARENTPDKTVKNLDPKVLDAVKKQGEGLDQSQFGEGQSNIGQVQANRKGGIGK